jgi:hypothetical protein
MKILLAVDGRAYTKKMLAHLTTHGEVFSANNKHTLVQRPAAAATQRALSGGQGDDRRSPHRGGRKNNRSGGEVLATPWH